MKHSFKMGVLALLLAGTASAASLPENVTPKDVALANPKAIAATLQRNGTLAKTADKAAIRKAVSEYVRSRTEGLAQITTLPGDLGQAALRKEQRMKTDKRYAAKIAASSAAAASKTVKVLSVLVDFADLKYDNNHITSSMTNMFYSSYPVAHFQDLMFSSTGFAGPSSSGTLLSARQYYNEESGNTFNFTGTVYGWVTASKNAADYGGNGTSGSDKDARSLVKEAVNAAVAKYSINLAGFDQEDQYDQDGDGNVNEPDNIIDHIMVFHASIGEEAGGGFLGDNAIWSHRWTVGTNPVAVTGTSYQMYGYTIQPIDAAAGVVSHEFGHDLGLPDEYDIDYSGDGEPVGSWSIMSGGSWAGSLPGAKPTTFSPWCRDYLQTTYGGNWINQTVINSDSLKTTASTQNLVPATNHGTGLINQVRVDLPVYKFKPFAGSGQYYSGMGDNLNHTASFSVTLPNTAMLTLKAKAHWDIEQDYDYVQVRVNGTAVAGSFTSDTNPYDASVHNYLTGDSRALAGATGADGWVDLSFDLSAYKNQTVTIQFAYVTDPGVALRGFALDNIAIDGSSSVYSDDAEAAGKMTMAGFSRVNSYDGGAQRYFVQLRNTTGNDAGLPAEQYSPGVLVWFSDDGFGDNIVRNHPGHGFNGVVDADQVSITGTNSTSTQIRDAAFGKNAQTSGAGDTHLVAIPGFSDGNDYFNEALPDAGLLLPAVGFSMDVLTQAADNSAASVQLSVASTTLGVSFTTAKNALQVNFTSQVSGGTAPYTYLWNFGDGGSSTGANPSHTYAAAGSYTVNVQVTDKDGTVVNSSQSVDVSVEPLLASFSSTKTSLAVSFASSVSGGMAPYTYAWDFGDGSSSSSANPSHTYAAEGSYTVVMQVTDKLGTVQSQTSTVTVAYPALTATISSTASYLVVNFSATVAGGTPGAYTYAWNFGDGQTSTSANISHTYAAAGTYNVSLQITDTGGHTVTTTKSVTVSANSGGGGGGGYGGGGGGSAELFGLALLAFGLTRKRRV